MIRILGPALVLKQFATDPSTGRVHIIGRRPGFIGWLLSVMGVDANTELVIHPSEVTFRQASLFGETVTTCPISRISSVSAGYAKPVEYLIAAVLSVITLIGPFIMLALFFLEKRVFISVETTGGATYAIAFKRSIIEGVAVDQERAKEVLALVQRNILMSAAADAGRHAPALTA
jgi:hypothetical protein